MISFDLPDAESAEAMCGRLRVIRHATSLGGVEFGSNDATLRRLLHLFAGLLRFSVDEAPSDQVDLNGLVRPADDPSPGRVVTRREGRRANMPSRANLWTTSASRWPNKE